MTVKNLSGTTPNSRLATRYAVGVGLLFTVIGAVKFSLGLQSVGLVHFLKYFLLLGGIYLFIKQVGASMGLTDTMALGFKISTRTAVFNTLFSSLILLFMHKAQYAEGVVPVDTVWKFAVNIMATFWGCIIFGGLSTYIVARIFDKN